MIPHLSMGAVTKWGGGLGTASILAVTIPTEVWVAGITTLGVAVTAWFAARQSRTEKRVDANRVLTDQLQEQLAWQTLRADQLEERLSAISSKFEQLRLDHTDYRIGAVQLFRQVEQLGGSPLWEPPSIKEQSP